MKQVLPKFLKKIYPFEQNYLRINANCLMHYLDEGANEVVLFLHGHPTWSFFFRNLILLLRQDFRCIAIDHIGYGLSSKPRNYKYTIENHISNGILFAEKMQFKKFHIVAHDFGVLIALAMAERWPERISSMSFLSSSMFPLHRISPVIGLFKFPLFPFFFARLINIFLRVNLHFGAVTILDSAVSSGYLWPYRKSSDRIAIASGIRGIPWTSDDRSIEILNSIGDKLFLLCNKKISFFWGEEDVIYDLNVLQAWKKVLSNAKHQTFPSAGYYLMEDSVDAINSIRSFVNRAKNIDNDLFK